MKAILAAAVALFTAQVQEPPARFASTSCLVRVAFYDPATVKRLCPGEGDVVACYWEGLHTIIMPNPWQCGSAERCAVLFRHEVAHACKDWRHEPF